MLQLRADGGELGAERSHVGWGEEQGGEEPEVLDWRDGGAPA